MNLFNIKRAHETAVSRGWDKMYWAIDLHDTVCAADYKKSGSMGPLYPGAQECLHYLSERPDIVLILFTCSYQHELNEPVGVLDRLSAIGIKIDYVNENPEVPDTKLGDFSKKFYFNVLLEDKAGFEGSKDWPAVLEEIKALVVLPQDKGEQKSKAE